MINNKPISDKSEITSSFNEYFSRIGLETSRNVPKTSKTFTDYLPNSLPNSMFLEPVTQSLVINTTAKLKSKVSSGHDEISTKLLKETITNIIAPMTHIFNTSLNTGIVPSQMKTAKVIPIFKYIKHLLNKEGRLYNYNEFINKTAIQINFLDYHSLLKSIPIKGLGKYIENRKYK